MVVGYVQFEPRLSCGKGKVPEAFAGVGVVSQLSPPPLELLLLLPPLLDELLLPPPLDELLPLLDEPLPEEELPEELLPPLELAPASEGFVSPGPPGDVEFAHANDKNPMQREGIA